MDARANLHSLGQPNIFLAYVDAGVRRTRDSVPHTVSADLWRFAVATNRGGAPTQPGPAATNVQGAWIRANKPSHHASVVDDAVVLERRLPMPTRRHGSVTFASAADGRRWSETVAGRESIDRIYAENDAALEPVADISDVQDAEWAAMNEQQQQQQVEAEQHLGRLYGGLGTTGWAFERAWTPAGGAER